MSTESKKRKFLVRIKPTLPTPSSYWYGSLVGRQVIVEESDFTNSKGELFFQEVGGKGKINHANVYIECPDYVDHNTTFEVQINGIAKESLLWYSGMAGSILKVFAKDTKNGYQLVDSTRPKFILPEHCIVEPARREQVINPSLMRKELKPDNFYILDRWPSSKRSVIHEILEKSRNFQEEQKEKAKNITVTLPKVVDSKLVLCQDDFDKIPLGVLSTLMLKSSRDLKATCLHYLGDEVQKWYAKKDFVKVDGLETLRLDLEKSNRTSFSRDEILFFISAIQAHVTYTDHVEKTKE